MFGPDSLKPALLASFKKKSLSDVVGKLALHALERLQKMLYGGAGAGICIEIEAPSDLVGKQIFYVRYPEKKSLNIDQLLRSVLDSSPRKQVYEMALLCKPPYWASEAEIRFVSKRQNVSVCLDGSRISSLVLGPNLTVEALRRIKRIAESLPYQLPLIMHKS
jgi:hypothetical protein